MKKHVTKAINGNTSAKQQPLLNNAAIPSYRLEQQGGAWVPVPCTEHKVIFDVQLPYEHIVFADGENAASRQLWHGVCDIARKIIERQTAECTVQNWVSKITCRYYISKLAGIESEIKDAAYIFLMGAGLVLLENRYIPGPDTDCMVNGTILSIKPFEECRYFEAPSIEAEIKATMHLPERNRFFAVTNPHSPLLGVHLWGAITGYDADTNRITLSPLNEQYPPVTLPINDIDRLYRVQPGKLTLKLHAA